MERDRVSSLMDDKAFKGIIKFILLSVRNQFWVNCNPQNLLWWE